MQLLALIVALLVSGAVPASAGPFEEAEAAYERNDFSRALRLLRPLAEKGHAGAQKNLGLMYWMGEGVPKDEELAAFWYRRAANQGEPFAQFSLGSMYEGGEGGLPKDRIEAYKWLNLSAASNWQGSALAAAARDILADQLKREQIIEAQRRTREWKPRLETPR